MKRIEGNTTCQAQEIEDCDADGLHMQVKDLSRGWGANGAPELPGSTHGYQAVQGRRHFQKRLECSQRSHEGPGRHWEKPAAVDWQPQRVGGSPAALEHQKQEFGGFQEALDRPKFNVGSYQELVDRQRWRPGVCQSHGIDKNDSLEAPMSCWIQQK